MTSLPDGQSREALVAYINELKEREDQISEIREEQSEICKSAKDSGFSVAGLRDIVRWLKKVDRHGLVKVEEAEALFDLYRQVHQGGAQRFDEIVASAQNQALMAKFVGSDQIEQQLSRRRREMSKAADMARGAREARG
jgi:uncharacterized protein (UPF0335 family)